MLKVAAALLKHMLRRFSLPYLQSLSPWWLENSLLRVGIENRVV